MLPKILTFIIVESPIFSFKSATPFYYNPGHKKTYQHKILEKAIDSGQQKALKFTIESFRIRIAKIRISFKSSNVQIRHKDFWRK
jgi:hypothetical protein